MPGTRLRSRKAGIARAVQKDMNVRWTVKSSKAKIGPDGAKQVDITIPVFGCKSHISVDRRNLIVRRP